MTLKYRSGRGYARAAPWEETAYLSVGADRNLFYGEFAVECVSLLAFILFLIWSIASSQICVIVPAAMSIAGTEVTMYYVIAFMIHDFFLVVAICLTFNIFWGFIHRFLGLIRLSGKPHVAVKIIHYLFFTAILLLSLAECALYIATLVGQVTSDYGLEDLGWSRLNGVLYIVYFVLSVEVFAWSMFVNRKATAYRSVSSTPATALVGAAVPWFIVCLTWAVISIRYRIMDAYSPPNYLYLIKAVIQLAFWVGTYFGILTCCDQWRALGYEYNNPPPREYPRQHSPQSTPPSQQYPLVQHPYDVAPYEPYDNSTQPPARHSLRASLR
ncbi:hypothetical protein PENVUL_c033G01947 [Penicillium vulpinum]|uniref:Uncharacterized protein n=1 Tax=Penicillium vulpinum TaxID=29845 RepID=A0A1V6RSH4_9EURO|nr:hypothetical protein PENVUL_c033G01947 [Penicillium vulpinum]